MKLFFRLFAVVVAVCLTSCGESQPVTTYEIDAPSEIHYPNFGTVKKKTKWDANRLCDDEKAFRVTKNAGAPIASDDVCDNCKQRWFTHDKK